MEKCTTIWTNHWLLLRSPRIRMILPAPNSDWWFGRGNSLIRSGKQLSGKHHQRKSKLRRNQVHPRIQSKQRHPVAEGTFPEPVTNVIKNARSSRKHSNSNFLRYGVLVSANEIRDANCALNGPGPLNASTVEDWALLRWVKYDERTIIRK